MGFYDSWNFDGLKFLSHIKDNPDAGISEPCKEFLSVIEHLKSTPPRSVTVAEIGIGYGATTLRALQLLDAGDVYYVFDFAKNLQALAEDLQARDFDIKCQLVLAENSELEWDSYNWNLSNLIFRMRERGEAGLFDAVYLDGAHTFLHDGVAVCLLKELICDGGFLILDDVFLSFNRCEWGRNFGPGRLTDEQMADYQILRVKKLFLDNDPNYEELSPPNAYRAGYRKRSSK